MKNFELSGDPAAEGVTDAVVAVWWRAARYSFP
jgi:hypothetical protein